MASKKKPAAAEIAAKRGLPTMTMAGITVYRKSGAVFVAPPNSTFGISQSGALVIQQQGSNPFTHAFAPGEWVSVNEK